jgi:hypothetical protein
MCSLFSFEWLLFVLVVAGVRPSGAPVLLVLGDRWHSVREVLRDVGIAAAFWIVSAGMLFVLAWLLRVAALGRKMDFILPHGGAEIALWIALSITGGYLRGDDLPGVLATAVHRPDKERFRWHSPFGPRH